MPHSSFSIGQRVHLRYVRTQEGVVIRDGDPNRGARTPWCWVRWDDARYNQPYDPGWDVRNAIGVFDYDLVRLPTTPFEISINDYIRSELE